MEISTKVFQSEELTPLTEIDLRSLAEVKDDRDVYLSVYVATNIRNDRIFAASRLRAMAKALPSDLREIFSDTMEMVEPVLQSDSAKGEKGRIIFASSQHGFLHIYRVSVEPEPLVVWDSSPFLLPLVKLKGEYEDFGLLLLDSQEARLFIVRSDIVEDLETSSIDLMNKHKKGGWSQMRFNRLRKGAIKSFFSQVADDLQDSEELSELNGLVIAGPGEAKNQFVEHLPPPLKVKVMGTIDADMETHPRDLAELGDDIARSEEEERTRSLAEKFKGCILRGEPAAYGLADVRKALQQGRANYLLISAEFALPGMICVSCHHVHEEGEKCPQCGGEMAALKLEEIYEMAERTGAEVALVEDDQFLESVGHVGAILRY